MSYNAIKVEGLSKLYRIGQREPYRTLRDAVTGAFMAPMRWFQNSRSTIRNPDSDVIWALKDASFNVKHGEVVGIIGRNGAGKSTLLKLLTRITEPSEGHADIYGRVGSLLEVGTGFHSELTGRENIYLNGAILGMKKGEIDQRFDEIVAFAEIEKFIETPVKHYSSGMYLRLAFAVAAHLEPEILLVDEVLAVGDLAFQNKCLNKMQSVSEGGRTILFVSHNMGAIHRLCKECILLDQGRIVLQGPAEEVIKSYISMGLMNRAEYSQAHKPGKPMNLRRVRLVTSGGESRSEFKYDEEFKIAIDYEVSRPISNCTVWVGIRTAEEIWVFGTADCDSDESMLGQRDVGYYRTTVKIPCKWLNGGQYCVVVGITKNAPLTSYDRAEAVNFTMLDINTPSRLRSGQGRLGVLQPVLEWVTRREGSLGPDVLVG